VLPQGIALYIDTVLKKTKLMVPGKTQPVFVTNALEQLFNRMKPVEMVSQYSAIVRLNAPVVSDILPIPTNEDEIQYPVILFVDSFQAVDQTYFSNRDIIPKGALHYMCSHVALLSRLSPLEGMIIAANSMPGQFISEDKTIFSLKVIHLELLLGAEVFEDITYELFQVHLNSQVLKQLSPEYKSIYNEKELSPSLSRLIIVCLLQCSGNGRAIENLYASCGHIISDAINKDMSGYDVHSNFSEIATTTKDFLLKYAEQYPESGLPLKTDQQKTYIELLSLMGVTKQPDSPLFPLHICEDRRSIEEYQKFGRFVSISIENKQRTYVGSFVLTKAFNPDIIVQELNPLEGMQNDNYSDIQIRLQWLVNPFTVFAGTNRKGDKFEYTIASSIWARYCIACLELNVDIGSSVMIEQVLPTSMIPVNCKAGKIALRGVARLNKQFSGNTDISILPGDRVLLNLGQAKFADVILPFVDQNNNLRFLGIHSCTTQAKPYKIATESSKVLQNPSFSFVFVSTYLTTNFKERIENINFKNNKSYKQILDNKEKIAVSTPFNLVSHWWLAVLYSFNPLKKVTVKA
jgi:hypothetical protein